MKRYGKTEKYWKFKGTFRQKYNNQVIKYREKVMDDITLICIFFFIV